MLGLFAVLLTVLFIGLKLTSHIDWEWWQVLLPFIIWLPIYVFVSIVHGILKAITESK